MNKRQKKSNYYTKRAYCEIFEAYIDEIYDKGVASKRLTKAMLYGLNFHRKQDNIRNYNYSGSFISNLRYAYDRMNGGRARSLLALFKKEMQ